MTVVLVSRLPEIIATSPMKVAAAVEKTAFDVEGGAKERSRVDTGQMKNGWTTRQISEFESEVYNPVEHAIFNELGTSTLAAQPMLTPSVEENREPFLKAVAEAWD